jgi:tetratricopeptide (TPR) repeat protein
MKRAVALCLCLCLVLTSLTAGIEISKRTNSMSLDEPNADSLLAEADEIFQNRDYAKALDKYLEVQLQARDEFNRSVETEALAQIARMQLLLRNKEESRQWLERASERASDSDPLGYSRYLGVKGRYEWKDNDLAAARQTFDEMYVYCNTNALWSRAVDAAHMIAIVAESPKEQVEWGYKGIEAAEAGGVESWLGPLWNNLAGTYYDMQNYDSALVCYLKSRDYHWRFSDEISKLFADYHVGMTYRLLGQFDEAKKWLRPVLAWAERLENHSAIGQACEDLGEIQIAEGHERAGIDYLRKARDAYQQAGFNESWPEVWNHINQRLNQLER